MNPAAIIFDMDGVLLDSEQIWHEVRRDFVASRGGAWDEADQRAVMGVNSVQWSAYIEERFWPDGSRSEIYRTVVDMLKERYDQQLPLIDGSVDAVRSLAGDFRLGLASSSPLELIRFALEKARLTDAFEVLVTSDEVAHGKPAPDVYLRACARLVVQPLDAVAVEDSSNGILAASAAGLSVIAIPNPAFPPSPEALRCAVKELRAIGELTPELIQSL